MNSKRFLYALAVAALLSSGAVAENVAGPQILENGNLKVPDGMARWPTVGSTVALSYEIEAATTFNTVRLNPESFDAYVSTGVFPVGTMLELEIRSQNHDAEPARGGTYLGDVLRYSIHVKDEQAGPGSWTFYQWSRGDAEARPFERDATCYACHDEHAETDTVFTQFYPVLNELLASSE